MLLIKLHSSRLLDTAGVTSSKESQFLEGSVGIAPQSATMCDTVLSRRDTSPFIAAPVLYRRIYDLLSSFSALIAHAACGSTYFSRNGSCLW